jgi:uncharacterized lipoprotein YmbA
VKPMTGGRTALMLLLAACVSPGPEPPPVRWFDPTPEWQAATTSTGKTLRLQRVTAASWLDRRFALRTGDREFTFDDQHCWIAEPQAIVAQVLEQSLFGSGAFTRPEGATGDDLEVHVTDFAFDLRGHPSAEVALRALLPVGTVATFTGRVAAADRSPAALAKAMAEALLQAVVALRTRLLESRTGG